MVISAKTETNISIILFNSSLPYVSKKSFSFFLIAIHCMKMDKTSGTYRMKNNSADLQYVQKFFTLWPIDLLKFSYYTDFKKWTRLL